MVAFRVISVQIVYGKRSHGKKVHVSLQDAKKHELDYAWVPITFTEKEVEAHFAEKGSLPVENGVSVTHVGREVAAA